jgi:hypothetical protein
MHKLILNTARQVDHRNCNKLDNRRSNLRIGSPSQNNANQKKGRRGSSRYKGVHWNAREKIWKATIGYRYKLIYLGRFNNEKDAARVYDSAAAHYYGTFARLNFPCQTPGRYRPRARSS